MRELDHKKRRASKNWCFQTVMLEKTLESCLDCKEMKSINPKGNQSWIFIGKMDAEAEGPNTLATWHEELTLWKRPWCWKRLKVRGEGDNRGWDGWVHHWLNGHEFEQALGVGSAGKEFACNAGDLNSTPGLERSLEKGKTTHSGILTWRILWTV